MKRYFVKALHLSKEIKWDWKVEYWYNANVTIPLISSKYVIRRPRNPEEVAAWCENRIYIFQSGLRIKHTAAVIVGITIKSEVRFTLK